MSAFCLYIGKQEGYNWLSNPKNIPPVDCVEGISLQGFTEEHLMVLFDGIIDPYADHVIDVDAFLKILKNKIDLWEKEITDSVLKELKQPKLEPWMNPLIDKKREQNLFFHFAIKLQKLFERAIIENGTVVYRGD